MDHNHFETKWAQIKTHLRKQWDKLTDEDIKHINGKRDQLSHTLRTKYNWDPARTEQELKRWETSQGLCCGDKCGTPSGGKEGKHNSMNEKDRNHTQGSMSEKDRDQKHGSHSERDGKLGAAHDKHHKIDNQRKMEHHDKEQKRKAS